MSKERLYMCEIVQKIDFRGPFQYKTLKKLEEDWFLKEIVNVLLIFSNKSFPIVL